MVGGDTRPREEGVLGDRRCTNHRSKRTERNSLSDASARVHPLAVFNSVQALLGAFPEKNPSEGLHLFFYPLFNHKITKNESNQKTLFRRYKPSLMYLYFIYKPIKTYYEKDNLIISCTLYFYYFYLLSNNKRQLDDRR